LLLKPLAVERSVLLLHLRQQHGEGAMFLHQTVAAFVQVAVESLQEMLPP
jgi:hypothetical protein